VFGWLNFNQIKTAGFLKPASLLLHYRVRRQGRKTYYAPLIWEADTFLKTWAAFFEGSLLSVHSGG
jgi:hypothetical protein